jgi:hypothetical protein
MATVYPTDVRLFIDDVDVTYWVFGVNVLTLSDINNRFRDIDISSYVAGDGEHKLEITCTGNVGRVEARVIIS